LPIIITHYETSEILYASPPIGDMLGITTDELPGKPVTGIYADPQQRSQILEKLKEQSTLDDEELTYRRADGSLLPATITSRRVIYAGDSAIISAITDLTERKAAEAELARQRDALHQADKMSALGSLLAGVAHELNNPLAVLVGQALMMEEQAQTQTQTILSERAAKIRNAAERCARIVKTFLSMARQRPAERSEVHLEQVIKAVLDLIDYSIRANDIGVQREIDAMLPSLWGDQDQFSQLILNLVINAQQALLAIESRRLLRISARPDRSAPGFVVLEVADNGPGVAPANRQRIFEPFFTTKPTGMGTGIGLSLCHSIVIAHGGTIECRESPEGGALFRVSLPVGQTGVEKKAEPARPRATVTSNHPILIVDDEPEIAEMLAEILQSGGYRTAIAHSGREALQRLEEQTFDLIVSDIRMPDLDGPGLYRALSGVHSGMRQRIIFVTGDILQSADTIALQKQVPIIEKPFDPDEIERIVGQQLMQLEVL
jgi:PAS domain S-box-containing protein